MIKQKNKMENNKHEDKSEKWFDCGKCGKRYKGCICECLEFSEGLRNLLKEARGFKMEKFKEKDGSISEALHIPYSGMSNPDYVHMSDFIKDDVYSLIIEFIENSEEEIKTIDELKEQIETLDDDGALHNHIESSLTCQQSLTNSDKIINYCSEYEEEDIGLWEGQQPEEAINSKAFFTYKSAVQGEIYDFIEEFKD